MTNIEKYGEVIEGLFKIESFKDGNLIDTYEEKNKIMTTARTAMARNMTGKFNTSSPINRIVLGNMGHTVDLLTPKVFEQTRLSTFSEAHQNIPNVVDLGWDFDGIDTLTNNSGSTKNLKHNAVYTVTMSNGMKREFRKIESINVGNTATYTIKVGGVEPLVFPTRFARIAEDLGLTFDGIDTITNNTPDPITLTKDVTYLVTMADATTKEFTKVLDETIPKLGGVYVVKTLDTEPLVDVQFGKNFIVDFDSTDYTLMTNEAYHETIILAADGTTKSQQITGIQSYMGLPVAPQSSGVNINVTTEYNKATFKFTIPQTQGNGESGSVVAYTEAALYCDEKIFSMKTFPARTKDDSLEYVITWVITF